VVGEDLDRKTSSLEPVAPVLKTFYDREGFLVGDPIIPLSRIHGLGHKADRMVAAVGLFLGEDSTIGIVRGIGLQAELSVGICMDKDGSLRNAPLQEFEGRLLVLGPLPGLILLEQVVERLCDVGEARDPSPIEVHKSNKFPNTSDQRRILPFCDYGGLLFVHFEAVATDIYSKELNFRLVELALLRVAEEVGFPKALKRLADSCDVFL